jgi:predicted GNAT family acetyltransferase
MWGPAREVRAHQPVLAIDGPPEIRPDPAVRRVRPNEIDRLLPAAIAMFTEEVGVSPIGADHGAQYRARVAELIRSGRAFARFEDGEVVFKADIGAATPLACQIQGVWVRPDRRGNGLAGPGMAAAVEHARRDVAPIVSLYVNDYNVAARAAYRRVGFREVGTFATVLF